MRKTQFILSVLSDALLKLCFGLIFFNYGYGKLKSMITGNSDGLINMVASIPYFGSFPLFFSWTLALGEMIILFALIYGLFYSLPFSNFITKVAGFLSLIISFVIVYQHVFAWGDNIFSYGPFNFLNASEGKKAIFGQFLFIPISMYIIFNSRPMYSFINADK